MLHTINLLDKCLHGYLTPNPLSSFSSPCQLLPTLLLSPPGLCHPSSLSSGWLADSWSRPGSPPPLPMGLKGAALELEAPRPSGSLTCPQWEESEVRGSVGHSAGRAGFRSEGLAPDRCSSCSETRPDNACQALTWPPQTDVAQAGRAVTVATEFGWKIYLWPFLTCSLSTSSFVLMTCIFLSPHFLIWSLTCRELFRFDPLKNSFNHVLNIMNLMTCYI